MRLKFNRSLMLDAFSVASTVAPLRSPKEVLMNVKLIADASSVSLVATDTETSIRVRVDDVEILSPGEALLPVGRFGNILREANDERMDLTLDNNKLFVKGSHSKFQLQSVDPMTFPTMQAMSVDGCFEMKASALKTMFRRTSFATDNESARYSLGGVFLEFDGSKVIAVGTDGRRLSTMECDGQYVGAFVPPSNLIIPSKAIGLIDKSISDKDTTASIAVRLNDVQVKTDRMLLNARLLEGQYPKWRKVVPTRTRSSDAVTVSGPLLSAVRQASIVAETEGNSITFRFEPGSLVMNAQRSDVGESRVELPVAYDGPVVTCDLSWKYVLDFLKPLPLDAAVTINMGGNDDALVFHSDDGYRNVIMPMAKL